MDKGELKVKITVGDEIKETTIPEQTSLLDILRNYTSSDEMHYVAAFVDDRLRELSWKLRDRKKRTSDPSQERTVNIEFLTLTSPIGFDMYKRGLFLLMLKAAKDVLNKPEGDYSIEIMYSIGNGFFCKLNNEGDVEINEEILAKIKERMLELVEANIVIEKKVCSTSEMREVFNRRALYGKAKLLKYRRASQTNVYSLDGYEDYYYGYMVPTTGCLTKFDLLKYDDGFVLEIPIRFTLKMPEKFYELKKLYTVLKNSEDWGRKLNINCVGELNDLYVKGYGNHLILAQEAIMEKQIAEIAQQIVDGNQKIILIAGPSSSGKTTFSNRLSVQLGANGLVPYPIAMDNFFKERIDTPKDENGKYDFESIGAMDLDLFNETMKGLVEGRKMEMPEFDFTQGKKIFNGKTIQLKSSDVLVVEGIHALNPLSTEALPKDSNFKIYASALTQLNIDEHNRISTTDTRLLRRIVRDARTRGNTAERTISMWQSVRRGEEKNIFPFQEQADVMFNSALIYELSAIKQFAEPLLFGVSEDSEEFYEAKRLLKFLDYFIGIDVQSVPQNSLIREFIGGGCFKI